MTDERLKIWIELGKWLIISVGFVLMTKIIDTGFKDREIGVNELKEYDKYVSLVTDYNKISERRLLAQYFAHVTPSKKLKEGWVEYYKSVDYEYNLLIKEKNEKQLELVEVINTDTKEVPKEKIEVLQRDITAIENELNPTFNKSITANNLEAAKYWEQIGFISLLKRDIENAIKAFGNSESAYNSYHQVYEIQQFLSKANTETQVKDDKFWITIYGKILKEFNWKMPAETKIEFEKIIAKQ